LRPHTRQKQRHIHTSGGVASGAPTPKTEYLQSCLQ
jgi:hypothetical protein